MDCSSTRRVRASFLEAPSLIIPSRYLAAAATLTIASSLWADAPHPVDPRLAFELVAREPEIVTPTGMAVDEMGRIWVIENHTHQRPPGYKGPESDRIRIFDDFDAAGKPRRIRTFAEGFRNSMGLGLGEGGDVFLATRSDIWLLRDTTGKGTADVRKVIVKLDSKGDYPHNGMSGFAFDALGNLYFGLGENLGADYKMIGSDGTTYRGGGEGGSIYRCRPDGTGLVRVATGFWNPFGLAVDPFGRLFAVDNDPDSRGPCRLLHIVQGGDYGYRYRNGRKGLHPFTSWDGELPGTLPMVAGTSEAPCGIYPCETTGLPAEYRGSLLVASWGDHLIERFTLRPQGASFRSEAKPIIRGGDDFRPVALAPGPDGCLYVSDWVDKSYPVHGKGRIWRLRWKDAPKDDGLRPSAVARLDLPRLKELVADPRMPIRRAAARAIASHKDGDLSEIVLRHEVARACIEALWALARRDPPRKIVPWVLLGIEDPSDATRSEAVRLFAHSLHEVRETEDDILPDILRADRAPAVRMQAAANLRSPKGLKMLVPLLADADPFVRSAALTSLAQSDTEEVVLPHITATDPQLRLGVLLSLRRGRSAAGRKALPRFLDDADPGVRRAAIQWVAEERLKEYADKLPAAAERVPISRDLVQAFIAAEQILAGQSPAALDEAGGDEFVARIVRDAHRPAAFRAVALRMLRPDHPSLKADLLREFVAGRDAALKEEAVRALAFREDVASQQTLRTLAGDRSAPVALRRFAVMGLAHSAASSAATRTPLLELLNETVVQRDALRSLRGARDQASLREALVAWWEKMEQEEGRPPAERSELAAQLLLVLPPASTEGKKLRERLLTAAGKRPKTPADWLAAARDGSAEAGERVFFHPQGARCFACHRIDGRGAAIGPELSTIGQAITHERLVESILTPSKEVAPRFVNWQLTLTDGRTRTGMIVDEGFDSTIRLADSQGKVEVIPRTQVEERHALTTSIMPDNLTDLMTVQEWRDLVAFLGSLGRSKK
jgi:putative membrane-bound dehydrogenase-like protein